MTTWLTVIGMGEDGLEAFRRAPSSRSQKPRSSSAPSASLALLPAVKAERHGLAAALLAP